MEPVAFTTGEDAAFLLLVSAGEVETAQVRTSVDLLAAHTDELRAAADGLKNGFIGVYIRVLLIHITDLHGLTDRERTFVGFLGTDDHAEECRLTGSVRTDDTHDSVRRQREIEVFEEQLVTKRLGYAFGVDDFITQTRTVGDEDLQAFLTLFLLLVEHSVVCVQTGFLLRVTCFRRHTDPFQLTLQGLATFGSLFLLLRHTVRLLLEPRRVIAFPRNTFSTIQFKNPTCHIIKEITVVGDTDDRSGILLQVLL